MSIEQEIIDVIVEQLGIDKEDVTPEKSLIEDLNADSLDLTEFMMTIEDRYNCEISQQDAEKLKTVGDVIKFIQSKQK